MVVTLDSGRGPGEMVTCAARNAGQSNGKQMITVAKPNPRAAGRNTWGFTSLHPPFFLMSFILPLEPGRPKVRDAQASVTEGRPQALWLFEPFRRSATRWPRASNVTNYPPSFRRVALKLPITPAPSIKVLIWTSSAAGLPRFGVARERWDSTLVRINNSH